jgi:hypothetical protein
MRKKIIGIYKITNLINDNERDDAYKTSLIFLAAKLDILEHTVRELTSKLENQEGD